MSLIRMGGGDIVMASTSYGGSSELTDLLVNRTKNLRKTTFDITGKNDLVEAVTNALKKLEDDEKSLRKRVCVFIEIPTNPDMKVPDVNKLAQVLEKFKESMKAKCSQFEDLFLMVDATFAPASQCMRQVKEVAPELTTMTFISMSKSVSRGVTCAGTIIAGPSQSSCDLLNEVKATASMLDTGAR
jgi:cysteine synthase A